MSAIILHNPDWPALQDVTGVLTGVSTEHGTEQARLDFIPDEVQAEFDRYVAEGTVPADTDIHIVYLHPDEYRVEEVA